jgi:hypothetical protein
MSFSQKVTTKGGVEKTVVADSQADLDDAVRAAEAERAPVTVDINVPVKKGHDLLHVEEDAVVQGLVDGSGAHNSPRGAIRDDGSVEGQDEVPVVVQRRGVNASQTGVENLQKVTGSGETAPLEASPASGKKSSK